MNKVLRLPQKEREDSCVVVEAMVVVNERDSRVSVFLSVSKRNNNGPQRKTWTLAYSTNILRYFFYQKNNSNDICKNVFFPSILQKLKF